MILILLLVILILISAAFRVSEFDSIFCIAEKFHTFCLNQVPANSLFRPELNALVCAENFSSPQQSSLYLSSGLIHLFVVSGAHLLMLEKIGRHCLPQAHQKKIIFVLLLFYGLFCALNPPVARSIIGFALNYYFRHKNRHWPAHFKILITGLLTLLFNYHWINSISLQLSWLAAFFVVLTGEFLANHHVFLKQFVFFLGLLPTLSFFQEMSLFTILLNVVLTPVLELILFPLGLIVTVFHPLTFFFDFIMFVFRWILQHSELALRPPSVQSNFSIVIFNWIFLFLLHMSAHLFYLRRKKQLYANN